ncbi:MAG: GspE/PulE family protein [Acidiferrobacterales bacterium]
MAQVQKNSNQLRHTSTEPDRKLDIRELLEQLHGDKLITTEDANRLRKNNAKTHAVDLHPLVVLASEKLNCAQPPNKVLDMERLTEWLAGKVGLPYFHIDPLKTNVSSIASVMKFAYATRNKILPVAVSDQEVTIAIAEPFILNWEKELSQILRKPIKRVLANPTDINRYTVEFYTLAKSVSTAKDQVQESTFGAVSNLEQMVELSRAGKLDANDQQVITIVDWLLQYAFEQRASDIHLEPRKDQGNMRFRIDGVLHLVYQLPPPVMAAVTSRLKILGRMDVAEKRRPQDGRIKTKTPEDKEIELRLSTMPTAFGEKLVMRIFDPEVLQRNFREMGLADEDLIRWHGMVKQPNGIILVTGPTGSGKTTTLYSTLKQLAKTEVNVCTIEDPIEMVEDSFNQMQVQQNIGIDFAAGVKNLLRQDPDIIMVGEIRDKDTADMAVQASLTGHLVLSTLHTNDAASAITRLLDIGIPPYLMNASLLGIVAQRLVRTLCPHCKEKDEVSEDRWKALVAPWKIKIPTSIYKPAGCLECRNTGFMGRIGIYEVLIMSPAIKIAIKNNEDVSVIRRIALKEGMRTLRISGAQKIKAGLTTLEEVFRVAPSHDDI